MVGLQRIILNVLISGTAAPVKYLMVGSDLEFAIVRAIRFPQRFVPEPFPMTSLDYQLSLSRTSNAPCARFKLQQNGDKVR